MGIKLLLADDSITIQKVVGIIFASDEYELTVVDNGNAAIEKAKEVLPDIVLVDALMPGKNGYEVCQAMRQDPALQHLPLLLLTGAFEPFDEEKARQCGADDFITKPFESQQLMQQVNKLLSQPRAGAVAASTVAVAPAEETVADQDDWAAMTAPDLAPLAEPTPPAVEAPVTFAGFESAIAETPVEAAPVEPAPAVHVAATDDLWGAFEMEEVPAAEAGSDVQELTQNQFVSGSDEFASALAAQTEESAIAGDWGAAPVEEELPPVEPAFAAEAPAAFAQESVGFSEESFAVEPTVEPSPVSAEPAFGEVAFAAPEIEAPVEPVVAPAVVAAPVAAPVAEAAVTAPVAAPAGSVTLSDEQLAELVAKISRDVIERIAWEVVPDLAETIIKEEIRKIKEGR